MRHFDTRHATKHGNMSENEDKLISDLKKGLFKQQNCFQKPVQENKAVPKLLYLHHCTQNCKGIKLFTDGEFIKCCMKEVTEILVPEKKKLFKLVSLSMNRVASGIGETSKDISEELNDKSKKFALFSPAFDDSSDIIDTAQLSIFIRGVTKEFIHENYSLNVFIGKHVV